MTAFETPRKTSHLEDEITKKFFAGPKPETSKAMDGQNKDFINFRENNVCKLHKLQTVLILVESIR